MRRDIVPARCEVYFDGQRVDVIGDTSPVAGTFDNAQPITVGQNKFYDMPFDGLLDELSIYARALTAAELQALFVASPFAPNIGTECPPSLAVQSGRTTNLCVEISGAPSPSLQWLFNGAPIGQTNRCLILSAVQPSDAGNYSIVASNVMGVVTQAVTTLAVQQVPPFFTSQPTNRTVDWGTTLSFQPEVSGSIPITSQWFFNGSAIEGATNPVLALSNVTSANQGTYSVALTNSFGWTNSSNVFLTVTGGPPVFVTSLTNQSVNPCATVTLQPGVLGSTPLTYQWFFNSTNLPAASASTLTISGCDVLNVGTYTVVVSNRFGSASNSASVALNNSAYPPVFTFPFAVSGVGYDAQTRRFALSATTDIASTSNKVFLVSRCGIVLATNALPANARDAGIGLTGADGFALYLANTNLYAVRNSNGTTIASWNVGSDAFGVSSAFAVGGTNFCIVGGTSTGIRALDLDHGTFITLFTNFTTSGVLGLDAFMRLGGKSLADVAVGIERFQVGERLDVYSASGTVLTNHRPSGINGAIRDVAFDVSQSRLWFGTQNSRLFDAAFDFTPFTIRPVITNEPTSQTVPAGSTVTFGVGASGTNLSFQWRLENTNVPNATNQVLVISNVQAAVCGAYTVRVSNGGGTVTSAVARLQLLVSPTIFSTGAELGFTSNEFHFAFGGQEGVQYVIEGSTNLSEWMPLSTNSAGAAVLQFSDSFATNFPWRFYRVRSQ